MFVALGKAYTGSVDPQRLHVGTLTLEQRDKLDEIWSRLITAISEGDEYRLSVLMYVAESTIIQFTLLDANRRKAELHKVAERATLFHFADNATDNSRRKA